MRFVSAVTGNSWDRCSVEGSQHRLVPLDRCLKMNSDWKINRSVSAAKLPFVNVCRMIVLRSFYLGAGSERVTR
jgi:hypothetical protein